MPTVTLELPVAGTGITAGLHATNYADLQALLNGGLDGDNIAAAAVLTFTSATLTGIAGLTLSGAGGKDTLNLSNTAVDTGITIGADVNLYRSAANILKTDDSLYVFGGDGDTQINRLGLGFAGIEFGADGAAMDVNLYRSAADKLQTDDTFVTGGNGDLRVGTSVVPAAGTPSNWLHIANTGAVPGTPTAGGVLYVESGSLRYKGSSGTITVLGPA